MASSNLTAIREKVRRLTRTPSESLLTTAQLDEYVNTFILYDFPEELRLFSLHSTFSFWTTPYVDTYNNEALSSFIPGANGTESFVDKYVTLTEPSYFAGYQGKIYQDRDTFYNIYPFTNFSFTIGNGDGVTTNFAGTLSQHPFLQHEVTFNSVDSNGTAIVMHDVPVVNATTKVPTIVGNLYAPGTEPDTSPTVALPANAVDYETGAYSVTFSTPPASGEKIIAQTVPYTAARPQILLWYDDKITVRPTPNSAYKIEFGVYVRPTALLEAGSQPQLQEWWQYIAYGAALKFLQDHMETDIIAQIMPEFKKQERLVLRRTIVNQTKERVSTIYTDQIETGSNNYGNGFWGL